MPEVANQNYKLGWVPPKTEPKLRQTFAFRNLVKVNLPPQVDLRPTSPPIGNQGDLGSCSAWATLAAVRYRDRNRKRTEVEKGWLDNLWNWFSPSTVQPNNDDFDPSELFNYFFSRSLDGFATNRDTGSSIASACKVPSQYGYCKDDLWPYVTSKFSTKPSTNAQTDAKSHLAPTATSVNCKDLDQVKTVLNDDAYVVFGMPIWDSIYNITKQHNIYVPRGRYLGGHALCVAGYRDDLRLFTLRNSWGTEYGDDGYFYMSYDNFVRHASDAWSFLG